MGRLGRVHGKVEMDRQQYEQFDPRDSVRRGNYFFWRHADMTTCQLRSYLVLYLFFVPVETELWNCVAKKALYLYELERGQGFFFS